MAPKVNAAKAQPKGMKKGGGQGSAKAKAGAVKKSLLKKAMKGPEMSLDQKLHMFQESLKEVDDASKGALMMQFRSKLSSSELQSVWGKLVTATKSDPELKEQYDNCNTKADKSKLIIAWNIDKSKGEVFRRLVCHISSQRSIVKRESWQPWKTMELKFGLEEASAHLESGRREDKRDLRVPGHRGRRG